MSSTGDAAAPVVLNGRYRLDALIGEGGMSRVHRATDTLLGRTVAVKVLRTEEEDPAVAQRLRAEIAVLASLAHPSLVTLFDAGIGGAGPDFLVMEHVPGETLRDRIARAPLAPVQTGHLGAELSEGLHVVHAAGIVHRDVKPSNVLLSADPMPGSLGVKLADFGIAYLVDTARVTMPGTVIGTAAYLAPEQVRGEDPSAATDIYSLGLVLLEAMTGLRAFRSTAGHEALVARLTQAPTIPPDLPQPWRELLAEMTAFAPADRPTALEVASATRQLSRDAPAASAAPRRRRPAVAAEVLAPTLVSTRVLPSAATSPPLRGVAVPVAAPVAAATAATGVLPRSGDQRDRRRRWVAGIGGVLAAGAVATAVAIGLAGADATPEPVSTPAVEPATPARAPVTDPATEPASEPTVDTGPATPLPEPVTDDGGGDDAGGDGATESGGGDDAAGNSGNGGDNGNGNAGGNGNGNGNNGNAGGNGNGGSGGNGNGNGNSGSGGGGNGNGNGAGGGSGQD